MLGQITKVRLVAGHLGCEGLTVSQSSAPVRVQGWFFAHINRRQFLMQPVGGRDGRPSMQQGLCFHMLSIF